MRKVRVIPRLDIKGTNLIKGVHLEGLRVLGPPADFAQQYYVDGADELLYMDTVASLYERNNILEMVNETAKNIFVPLTVGGGIRNTDDAFHALRNGADKIAINTAAIKNPHLISQIASDFGSQCVVVSIEAKQLGNNHWECFFDNGREKTGIDVVAWTERVQELGAGEILLTSIDNEGTGKGFDIALVNAVLERSHVPVIAAGGMGNIGHLQQLLEQTDVDAIAIAKVLHEKSLSISDIHQNLAHLGCEVRC